ncbi:MAG: ABC transporter permease subunit [Clostridiaceae bacterium]|nr:ABC transporter permease subunit [Clostridiaceae bacterium]
MKKIKRIFFLFMLCLAFSIIIFSFIAPKFAPNDPLVTDFQNVLREPTDKYPFGTDQVGRCIYSRILYGAKTTLSITFLLLGLVFLFGLIIGTIAGMIGGKVDTAIMRITDIILSFPDMVLAIAVVGMLGPGLVNTVLALSLIWWTKYARLSRVLVMSIKNREYIDAGRMAGGSPLKLITRYIFPNIISPLVVQLAIDIGSMMLAIAGLSFLGLGVQPPAPEWGNMLNEGRAYMQTAPWLLIYPGMAIFIVVCVFNVLGDTLRDVLDPKHI